MFDMFICEPQLIGNTVYVQTLDGQVVGTYNALELTRAWLTMSNDSFYNNYGFSWIPPIEMQDKVRKVYEL